MRIPSDFKVQLLKKKKNKHKDSPDKTLLSMATFV